MIIRENLQRGYIYIVLKSITKKPKKVSHKFTVHTITNIF